MKQQAQAKKASQSKATPQKPIVELSNEDLDKVTGGATNDVKGIDIIIKKKPNGGAA